MNKLFVIASMALALFISFTIHASENDFDKVCDYFGELQKMANEAAMTHQQRNTFIMDKISKDLPAASNARAAWEAIGYAEAEQRYELFKSAAESVINTPWQCPAMEKLAPKTGEF
jgi:hypothetical protein